MTKSMTYNELMIIEQDMRSLAQKSPSLHFLMSDKIERFYKRNNMRIERLHDNMSKIQEQYIKLDSNGIPALVDAEGGKDWDWRPEAVNSKGLTVTGSEVREAYRAQAGEFLAISFPVEW